MQDLDRLRERYLTVEEGSRMNQELVLLDELLRQKLIKEEEYQKLKRKIQEKGKEKQQKEERNEFLGSPSDEISAPLVRLMDAFSVLDQKIKNGEDTWKDYAAVAVTSIQLVSGILSSVSGLMQANQSAEEAKVTARYDAEIEKAGESTKQGKKLEEQKQKELAQIKNKYNKKMMEVEIAQAIAQTSMAAIAAYASAAAIPVTGWIMAPIAAAAAIAAGAIQIEAIKKQHEAQATGYYEGGFTGGTHYRRVAGEVHEGEFVANHLAVANPNLLPFFQLIDHAQRNNTVASLTAEDVGMVVGAQTATAAAITGGKTSLHVIRDEKEAAIIQKLSDQLEEGIPAYVVLDGPDGLDEQYKHFKQLTERE